MNSAPVVGEEYYLQIRRSKYWDWINYGKLGVAICSDPLPPSDSKYSSLFHGWIWAFDKHIVFKKVKAGYVIKMKILESHYFDWLQGDGCCYSG